MHNTSIQECKGIGPSMADKFKKINIHTISDLLFYFPRKYQDRSKISKIKGLVPGNIQAVFGSIVSSKTVYLRGRFTITKTVIQDDTGVINLVWYNQPYLQRVFKAGDKVFAYGKVEEKPKGKEILNPEYEVLKEEETKDPINMGRIVPVYGLTKGISNKVLRKIINNTLAQYIDTIEDFLPCAVTQDKKLPDIKSAVNNIHFPENLDILKKVRYRFVYEELFLLMAGLKYYKNMAQNLPRASRYENVEALYRDFTKNLPFTLTDAQNKVCLEIIDDFKKDASMQRLIIGDVGCGKTVVAAYAAFTALSSGYQAAYMAPTEILAYQHFKTFEKILSAYGFRICLLTGGLSKSEKDEAYQKIKNKEIDLIIGTHALIQDKLEYGNIGIVIIDEQHKFGVGQRLALKEKANNPDLLIMTATPIPRTLALTLFGDMDISIIDQMPAGRKPVKSYFVPFSYKDRVYKFIREQTALGRQAFIVCPLIEETENDGLRAVEKEYKVLRDSVFTGLKVGLLHGRMSAEDKDDIMKKFKNKETDILVSTTVIEVGIDIPNANIMVVKNAERFGLSQLHQLRGRIGRGEHESYCVLMSDHKNEDTKKRLKDFCAESDGFKIAQLDLEARGTGEFFGQLQHGYPELRIADPLRDIKILEIVKKDAEKFISADRFLRKRDNAKLKKRIKAIFEQDEIVL